MGESSQAFYDDLAEMFPKGPFPFERHITEYDLEDFVKECQKYKETLLLDVKAVHPNVKNTLERWKQGLRVKFDIAYLGEFLFKDMICGEVAFTPQGEIYTAFHSRGMGHGSIYDAINFIGVYNLKDSGDLNIEWVYGIDFPLERVSETEWKQIEQKDML